MKKTFNVNISGIIFHIDEDAYDQLNHYLNAIKQSFSSTEGKEEIIADIEARIAELLQERITDNKQVVVLQDVEQIIAVMGEVSQIDEHNNSEQNISEEASKKSYKRLFRDPDNKILGGVCAGIANYFKIDPMWVRIIFVIALFVFSTGLFIYILLWVIVPIAKTTAEKLEMRGEPITISNIEKSIKEEFSSIKEKFKDLKTDSKDFYQKSKNNLPRNDFERLMSFIVILIKYFVKAVAIFIGLIFMIIGLFLLIGLISSFFKGDGQLISVGPMGISTFSLPIFLRLFFEHSIYVSLTIIGMLLVVGIPLLMLIYNGIKLIFGFKTRIRAIGISSFSLWLAGLVLLIFSGVELGRNYSNKSLISKKVILTQPTKKHIYLNVKRNTQIENFLEQESELNMGRWNMINDDGNRLLFGTPQLNIIKNDNDSLLLTITSTAKGSSKEDARKSISQIQFNFTQQDTLLTIDKFFLLPQNDRWRDQRIKLVLRIPNGYSIFISNGLEHILNDVENVGETYDEEMVNKNWLMTPNGLKQLLNENIIQPKDSLKPKK